MIHGHEIRLGNYFKDRHNKVIRVDYIEYVQKGYVTKFGQKVLINDIEVDFITEYSDYAKPIKLTPEWMEKLGFDITELTIKTRKYEPKDRGAWNYYVYFMGDIIIFGLDKCGVYINLMYDHKNLQYVHQFQNLYYALTGVELTVKNE